jgi:hypothetical protein
MEKSRIVTLGFRVGSLTRPFRDARRFPSYTIVARYDIVHVRRESVGVVSRSRTIFCRAVPHRSVTIRDCSVAVRLRALTLRAVGGGDVGFPEEAHELHGEARRQLRRLGLALPQRGPP